MISRGYTTHPAGFAHPRECTAGLPQTSMGRLAVPSKVGDDSPVEPNSETENGKATFNGLSLYAEFYGL